MKPPARGRTETAAFPASSLLHQLDRNLLLFFFSVGDFKDVIDVGWERNSRKAAVHHIFIPLKSSPGNTMLACVTLTSFPLANALDCLLTCRCSSKEDKRISKGCRNSLGISKNVTLGFRLCIAVC